MKPKSYLKQAIVIEIMPSNIQESQHPESIRYQSHKIFNKQQWNYVTQFNLKSSLPQGRKAEGR